MNTTTDSKWDTDLMYSQIQNIDSQEARSQLCELTARVYNHQLYPGEQWAAHIYADQYFNLFSTCIRKGE